MSLTFMHLGQAIHAKLQQCVLAMQWSSTWTRPSWCHATPHRLEFSLCSPSRCWGCKSDTMRERLRTQVCSESGDEGLAPTFQLHPGVQIPCAQICTSLIQACWHMQDLTRHLCKTALDKKIMYIYIYTYTYLPQIASWHVVRRFQVQKRKSLLLAREMRSRGMWPKVQDGVPLATLAELHKMCQDGDKSDDTTGYAGCC